MDKVGRKTPSDTTEFEREQLRFFLGQENVGSKLVELNPSLAWLPELVRMKGVSSASLAPWIERNFGDPEAVRQVSANLGFFDEKAAEFLEFNLARKRNTLPVVLAKSWDLIIRHIRDNPRGMLRSEWYEIVPRLKAGESSAELVEKFAQTLRPKPKISKKIKWPRDETDDTADPVRPSDLMTVDYEVDDSVSETEALAALPDNASSEIYQRFLVNLVHSLNAALADAEDAEVESNRSYSISDTDVPSVAGHFQNEYHKGFLPIVRVTAETWIKLAREDASLALPYVGNWASSAFKLNNRLALFAAADRSVPSHEASSILMLMPQGLLFLTGASVEVFRLIQVRWNDFSNRDRTTIEQRILAGPPVDWFKADADLAHHLDRARFDILAEMARQKLELSEQSQDWLADVKRQHPTWELRPAEQAGFHVWHGRVGFVSGDPNKFRDMLPEALVDEAKRMAEEEPFENDADWRALCQENPALALEGLKAKAKRTQWPTWAWSPFLWATQNMNDPICIESVGKLLLEIPDEELSRLADGASWWLNEKSKALDEQLAWRLWDRIVTVASSNRSSQNDA